jgi:hypothetical protein
MIERQARGLRTDVADADLPEAAASQSRGLDDDDLEYLDLQAEDDEAGDEPPED